MHGFLTGFTRPKSVINVFVTNSCLRVFGALNSLLANAASLLSTSLLCQVITVFKSSFYPLDSMNLNYFIFAQNYGGDKTSNLAAQ